MKKLLIPFILMFGLIVSACDNHTNTQSSAEANNKESNETITYQSENGPIKVPAHPKRVVVLTSYAGDLISLGVNIVGVESWTKKSPLFKDQLKGVPIVSDEDLEKIIKLKPDLIIGSNDSKNLSKLKKIAPTVTYTYNKVDYLTQHLEIGKLVNKEKEAQSWINDFKKRANKVGNEIRAKIGENSTVTVMESYDKNMGILGDSWGRGTEVLYQALHLKMPEKVQEMTKKEGYYMISSEILPDYVGDYLVVSKYNDQDNSYQRTGLYKRIPAVKNNHVIEVDGNSFMFNDAVTLDYQLKYFEKQFLK
ncbi:iron-hydroxamate ABC transporter substrate-binding protein [Priestia megaterium]|uniref:iron-hydroxamate ABC transporter substrate-binding protein n=1 Tax=Priestia megaterium TaxID=1404 RepID=UPI000BF5E36E|nr:iron-hydroxamate ABC transporter substrate-binding protein [Priestia megaterium]MED4061064.1 iron-hydroxamate ABC transporter substrate-binding protein [Priestia megaterium]PEZ07129.1 ABC transporter substrate-binding protein [Priestia megaterium]